MRFVERALIEGEWDYQRALMLAMLAEASYARGRDIDFVLEEDLGLELVHHMPFEANQGFVARGSLTVILAYAGTNQVSDWLANLHFRISETSWGQAHTGFLEAYQAEEEKAEAALDLAKSQGLPLWITGHSLGGALAHVAAHQLSNRGVPVGIATFGQPRTVNVAPELQLQSHLQLGYHRVVNENDIVPRVPPNFAHTGHLVQLGRRRRLFGTETEGEELPPMTELEFSLFQDRLRAIREGATERSQGRSAAPAAEAAIDRSAEGLIPGLRDHRMSAYIAALEKVAGERVEEEVFEGLLSRPVASRPSRAATDKRNGGDVAGDVFGDKEGLFDDAPENAGLQARAFRSLVEVAESEATEAPGTERLPVLFQLKPGADWTADSGMHILSQTGDFVTALLTAPQVTELERNEKIRSIEISRIGGRAELETSMPFVNGRSVDRHGVDEMGSHAIVGIIDTGVDVLHEAFVDAAGNTRILAIWDQLDSKGPSPKSVDPAFPFDFGTLYTGAQINEMRAGRLGVPDWLRDPEQHGTHVAGIAAGRATGTLPDGMAPEAGIAVVIPDMETISGNPASLGYSVSHTNALEFLRILAQQDNSLSPDNSPIAINVSLGMNAGAHDGQTLLEAAFDSATGQGRDAGIVVVKSAGNERPHRGHANVAVALGRVDVDWTSLAEDRGLDYFEAWYFKLDVLEFVLHAPDGAISGVVSQANRVFNGILDGNKVQMRLRLRHPDNGDNVLYISIRPDPAPIARGVWTLEVRGKRVSADSTGLDIWVERTGSRAVEFDNAVQQMTVSIPGTANHIITVSATDTAADYPGVIRASSFGPTRDGRSKPELSAPGSAIVSAHANQSDRSAAIAMTGTSMAAPHVSGAVSLALSRRVALRRTQFNSEQISALLVQSVQFNSLLHHHGFGYGILDVAAFLELCDQEP